MQEIRRSQQVQRFQQVAKVATPVLKVSEPTEKVQEFPRESFQVSSAPVASPAAEVQISKPQAEVQTQAPQVVDFNSTSVGHNGQEVLANANGTISLFETPDSRPSDPDFTDKYGPWGVVTGASQGIGAEYARALAEKGMNVVMIARRGEKMSKLAKDLHQEHGVDVRVISADLSTEQGVEQVKQGTKDLQVGLLVNNAGSWQMGSFLDQDIEKAVDSVGLNLAAPIKLTHHFAKEMGERGKGGVLNVGSMAALHGVPGQASYSGNKGYLRNFTESLHRELKPQGIDVMITNPGPVKGEASSAIYDTSKIPLQKVTPRQVAVQSLERMGKGGSSTVPGWLNRQALGAAVRLMPRDYLTSIAGYLLEKASLKSPENTETNVSEVEAPIRLSDSKGNFKEKYGPWAVVTGASQGLGSVYAEQLAQKGLNVVIVARSGDKLNDLAGRLEEKYGVQVKSVPADMSKPEGLEAIHKSTEELDVGLLVNNAGVWQMGSFLDNDIHRDAAGLDLNVSAPMKLCHEFGNRMRERGGGGIINVGSGAAAQGIPGQATYSAGKGFLQNFTESLNGELKEHGIDVMITNPAGIKGEASSIYDQSKIPLKTLDPELVVNHSLESLGHKTTATPGLFNRLAVGATNLLLSRDQRTIVAGKVLERATRS